MEKVDVAAKSHTYLVQAIQSSHFDMLKSDFEMSTSKLISLYPDDIQYRPTPEDVWEAQGKAALEFFTFWKAAEHIFSTQQACGIMPCVAHDVMSQQIPSYQPQKRMQMFSAFI